MKAKRFLTSGAIAAVFLMLLTGLAFSQAPDATPLGTGFTYQGQLSSDGTPYSGTCDFQFGLYDAATMGMSVGELTVTDVSVSEGIFTTQLDFGSGKFTGDNRWLEIWVRCPAGGGTYQQLLPRQALTAAPYALYAEAVSWSGITGVPAGFADEVDNDTNYTAGLGLYLADNTFSVNTSVIQKRVDGTCGDGSAIQSVYADGSVMCEPVGGTSWSLTGNYGTTPGTNFLGTTDNQALDIRVNNLRAFRFEPNDSGPNLIGGYLNNWVTSGVYGVTISGGGGPTLINRVTDNYGTIGGGGNNQAGDNDTIVDDAMYATVAGGYGNWAGNVNSTVGGGVGNSATGYDATIGGGANNTASSYNATIAGGYYNSAFGDSAFIGGGLYNYNTGLYGTVTGGGYNTAEEEYPTIGGGYANQANANHATISGGFGNTASGIDSTIGGGNQNVASGATCTISGGEEGIASGYAATVGGGSSNSASGIDSTISGGYSNEASADDSTIGGGNNNTASAYNSTISGGYYNTASGLYSTVPGGSNNTASGDYSFAAGHNANAILDGSFVWADTQETTFSSIAENTFNIRAQNGVWINADNTAYAGEYVYNSATTGTSAGQGTAILGHSDSNYGYGVAGYNFNAGVGVGAWSYDGNLIEAYDGDYPIGILRFYVDNTGNVHYDGTASTFAEIPSPTRLESSYISLYGISAAEAWYEDLGSANLLNGKVTITIGPLFAQTVSLTDGYQVQVTATCDQAVLLFVSEKTDKSFTVQGVSLDGKPSSCGFDYRISAKPLGLEGVRLETVDIPEPVIVDREQP